MKKIITTLLLPGAMALLMAFSAYKVPKNDENTELFAPNPATLALSGYKVGDKAADFKLPAVDGLQYSMSTFTDAQGFVIIFTCNTCPVAKKYEKRIIDLHRSYFPQGYPVIAINSNNPSMVPGDSFAEMKKRAQQNKYPFTYLSDADAKVCNKFGASNTPHVFLLDKNRIVRYIGAIDDNQDDANAVKTKYLENAILALKSGKNPEPSLTKAIGCGIKKKGV